MATSRLLRSLPLFFVAFLLPPASSIAADAQVRATGAFGISLPPGFSWVAMPDARLPDGGPGPTAVDLATTLVARSDNGEPPSFFFAVLDKTPCPMTASCIDQTVQANVAAMEREGTHVLGVREKRSEAIGGVRAARVVLDADFPAIGRRRVLMYFIPHEWSLLGLTYAASEAEFATRVGAFDAAAHRTTGAEEPPYDSTSSGARFGTFLGRFPVLLVLLPAAFLYGVWRSVKWVAGRIRPKP